jgi:uncharacterized protein (TIGR02145 family)
MKYIYLILLLNITSYAQLPCPGTPTVDYGGKTYNTVQIGSQCWLKENLNIGTSIIGKLEQTNNNLIEKYCYNDDSANCTIYGGLYEWAEAVQYQNGTTDTTYPHPTIKGNVQGICPTGWHVPADSEFTILSSTLSGDGNAVKAVGQGTPPGAGTNTSGFSALLAGTRYNGNFYALATVAYIWSSTAPDSITAYYMRLYYIEGGIYDYAVTKKQGNNVRCLKDITVGIDDNNKSELPKKFLLFQNYPNPFNPSTTIKYQIPSSGFVNLKVYDILGKDVATLVNENKIGGPYEVSFDASKLTNGIYIYQLMVNDFVSSKKMILLK